MRPETFIHAGLVLLSAVGILGGTTIFAHVLSMWMVFGFTPLDLLRGWQVRDCGLIYIMPRLAIKPTAVYWLADERTDARRLAAAMSRARRLVPCSSRDWSEDTQRQACLAKFDGQTVWPSREAAELMGEPDAWYPTEPKYVAQLRRSVAMLEEGKG